MHCLPLATLALPIQKSRRPLQVVEMDRIGRAMDYEADK
jgi:hypothetical protein